MVQATAPVRRHLGALGKMQRDAGADDAGAKHNGVGAGHDSSLCRQSGFPRYKGSSGKPLLKCALVCTGRARIPGRERRFGQAQPYHAVAMTWLDDWDRNCACIRMSRSSR